MLYAAYEARRAAVAPLFGLAGAGTQTLRGVPQGTPVAPLARAARAVTSTVRALELTHVRPEFGIDDAVTPQGLVGVREETVLSTPFASLRHFVKDAPAAAGPPVLVIPGLAGHFATLVRGTIRTMLADHDVYVADWHNARDVRASAGPFGLDEFILHLVRFLRAIGARAGGSTPGSCRSSGS
jgi:polyhydroxyalkanoate depolymerase